MGGGYRLPAHVHDPVLYAGPHAPEEYSFEPPVREINYFFISILGMWEQVMKKAAVSKV
jgi:hypothetical protein